MVNTYTGITLYCIYIEYTQSCMLQLCVCSTMQGTHMHIMHTLGREAIIYFSHLLEISISIKTAYPRQVASEANCM